jgi:WXG100 protein secretion system (Wss), protein YukD
MVCRKGSTQSVVDEQIEVKRRGVARLLVSVDGPSGRRDLALPDDARLEDLLPAIVREFEPGLDARGWTLAPQGEAPIPPGRTLGEAGLFPGAVLVLSEPAPVVVVPTSPRPPRIEGMRERAYLETLDAAITARRSPSSTVVAVVGGQPGAGATTVAALLAMALGALRGESVVAVDGNPGSGALSHWLVPDAALPADVYRSLFSADVKPAHVSHALVGANTRLSVLPAPLDPTASDGADPAAWERLIEHLRRMHHAVVVDGGTRRGARWADAVVLVTRFGHDQAEIAAAIAGSEPVVKVINQAPRRARIRGGTVTLAAEPQAAARLKRRGFAWADAPASWQEAVRELAAVLLAGA